MYEKIGIFSLLKIKGYGIDIVREKHVLIERDSRQSSQNQQPVSSDCCYCCHGDDDEPPPSYDDNDNVIPF